MKLGRMLFLVGFTIVIFVLSLSANVEARGMVPVIIGFGEHISPVADLPDSEYIGTDLGYLYSSIRIFYIPIMTWDGKFVLYKGDHYLELSENEVKYFEAEYGPVNSKVNFWVRYVNWLWLIAPIAILIWLKIGHSQKNIFVAMLVIGVLLLGYWVSASGPTNAPETLNSTLSHQPKSLQWFLQKPTGTPATDQKTFTNSIGMEFVQIPAGEFDMGSRSVDYERDKSEEPVHRVTLETFCMSNYEITQKQWREVMGNIPPAMMILGDLFKGDDLPVVSVSWNEVQEFIKKLNEREGTERYRLPSEAEWEYAARAGTATRYSFGDPNIKLYEYAWCSSNSGSTIHRVGQKKPNHWGLYDMHGNVLEWVQDTWYDSYNGAPTDGSAWESRDGSFRVIRGGGCNSGPKECRSANRDIGNQCSGSSVRGFRLAMVAPNSTNSHEI